MSMKDVFNGKRYNGLTILFVKVLLRLFSMKIKRNEIDTSTTEEEIEMPDLTTQSITRFSSLKMCWIITLVQELKYIFISSTKV